jgi:hypothetical protein
LPVLCDLCVGADPAALCIQRRRDPSLRARVGLAGPRHVACARRSPFARSHGVFCLRICRRHAICGCAAAVAPAWALPLGDAAAASPCGDPLSSYDRKAHAKALLCAVPTPAAVGKHRIYGQMPTDKQESKRKERDAKWQKNGTREGPRRHSG